MDLDLSNENMLHVKGDGIEYLQFKRLLEFDNLINCYTLSVDGINFKSDTNKDVLENSYQKLCKAMNIEKDSIIRPHQSHTDCIKNVENNEIYINKSIDETQMKYENRYQDVDGLLTDKKGVNLMLSFADCTPILLYDQKNKIIGNVHSGWRGTVQKIGQKAVYKMIKDYGSKPENIIACIGPCIGKCHFEVEDDVKQIFEQTFRYLEKSHIGIMKKIIEEQEELVDGKKKYHIDTTLINKQILEDAGLISKNIITSGICTVCNSKQMHSHRANGQQAGRNIALIGIRN